MLYCHIFLAFTCSALLLSEASALSPLKKKCPLKPAVDVENHHEVELNGVKIALSCGMGEKLWKKPETVAEHDAKAGRVLSQLPEFTMELESATTNQPTKNTLSIDNE